MAKPLHPQQVRPIGVYGLIREAEVDSKLIPEGAVTESINFHFDRKGVSTVRPGVTNLGGTSVIYFSTGNPCIGLYNWHSSLLIAAFGVSGSYQTIQLYRYGASGNNWVLWQTLSNASFITGTAKVRFTEFNEALITMSGASTSQAIAARFYDAGGGVGSGNEGAFAAPSGFMSTFPSADVDVLATSKFSRPYKSRLYISGTYSHPSRLYWSSVIDTNGFLMWSPSVDYVDINPGDGEVITALERYSLELLIFKPNYIYRFRTSGLDPDPLIKVGTRSQESVVEGKRGLYFHNDNGFFRYTGGYPEEISRAISDIVLATPPSQYASVAGWKDSDHIYWSLGNLTISEARQNVTWKNVVVRYTESSGIWTVYSYPFDIRRGTVFVNNSESSMSVVVGLDNGSIAAFNSGTTDIGEPISYRLVTKWYEWEGVSNTKTISRMIALCEKAQGLQVMCQVDNNLEWETLAQINKWLNFFKGPSGFHRVRFKVTGSSRFESAVFQGLEILEGINEGSPEHD